MAHRRLSYYWPGWLILIIMLMVVFNGLPFLAPVFMKVGWSGAAQSIYLLYSFLCHQMAQRSFFLFGPSGFQMYEIANLPLASAGTVQLREFIGTPEMGWKVAWSDRMVYMYGSTLSFLCGYGLLRKHLRFRPLSLGLFCLLLLPMVVDGGTHAVSDLAGIGQGFRDSNQWLAVLTGQVLPAWFYAGDGLGSFNSWMRLFSGVTFGLAVVGFFVPLIDLSQEEV